jgi:hypothetical protein
LASWMKLKRLDDPRSTQLSLAARCCRDNVLPSPIFHAAPQYQYPNGLFSGLSDRGMTLVSDNCRDQAIALKTTARRILVG